MEQDKTQRTGEKSTADKKRMAQRVKEVRERLEASYDRAVGERQQQAKGRHSPLSLVGLRVG